MMKDFLILVAVIAIWVVVARLLSRHFIRKGHKPWLSKTSGGIVGFVVALFFLVLFIPTQDKNEKARTETSTAMQTAKPKNEPVETPSQPEDASEETVTSVPEVTLEISPEVFSKRMNANLKTFGSSFRLKAHIESGEVKNVFKYTFNDHLAIVGTVDKKSKNLSGITLITRGDGTAKSGADVMAVVVSAYSAVLGENTMKTGEPAKIVIKLVKLKEEKKDNTPTVSTIFNGVKFSYMSSDTIGNLFTAEPI
ncbi:hypothetical protein ACP3TC_09785 [Winslowiella sp. 2C04]|uniref:hypothetical protein n=1 Tax=Winslowiella sp. 2C04 TaxID=3416179 RepID=UPI003CECCE5A